MYAIRSYYALQIGGGADGVAEPSAHLHAGVSAREGQDVEVREQRAYSPQLAAGLASEYKIRLKVLTVEDSLQPTAGRNNFV